MKTYSTPSALLANLPSQMAECSGVSPGSHAIIDSIESIPTEEVKLAQLIVRSLDQELVRRLKIRAARHGRSMEAEHREILQQALLEREPVETLKELLLAMPPVGEDADFERLQDKGREAEI
jgi:antitoxin FitA